MNRLVWCLAVAVLLALLTLASVATSRHATMSFSFGASGDFSATSNTDATLNLIGSSGLAFHLALGDLSYATLTPESSWCSYVHSHVGSTFPFELIPGNHDSAGSDQQGYIDNFAACLPDRLGGIRGTYGKEYYFDYPASKPIARFILISPNLCFYVSGQSGSVTCYSYAAGTSHYTWLANTIDAARAAGIPWVIVGMHETCISTGVTDCQITNDLENLMISKKVDLILQGHDHDYQRSKQLALNSSTCTATVAETYNSNCVVNDGSTGTYTKGAGSIIVIDGTSGSANTEYGNIYTWDGDNPYFATWMGTNYSLRYGFMKYTLSATQLSAQFMGATSSNYTDAFTIITTSLGATNTPTATSTTPPPTATTTPVPTSTATAMPTNTAPPTSTPTSMPTNTSPPTSIPTSMPTNTSPPTSTPTSTPSSIPVPRITPTATPTSTPVPRKPLTPTPTPDGTPSHVGPRTTPVGVPRPLGPTFSASSWAMINHDAQATRFNGAEHSIGVGNVAHLHPVWMLPITTGPAPVASGNQLFTPLDASMGRSARGSLGLAVQDSLTGRTLRRFSMAALHLPSHDVLATLAFADGKLLVSDLGDPVTHPVHPAMLLAIDVHSGRIVWRVQTPSSWLTIAGKIIYTGFDSSSAIDLRTGRILWRHRGAFEAPVVVGGRLYQAERVGHTVQMQVYAPRTGRLLATLPRLSDARLTGDSHTVYAVHMDLSGRSWLGRIGSRGKAAWKVDLGPLQFSAQPVLAYHTLYMPANRAGAGVVAVRAADGHILWQARIGPNVSLIAANNLLFALHRPGLHPNPHLDGHIDVLNAHTGRLLRRLDMTPYLQRHGLSSASLDDLAIAGGTLFLYDHGVCLALHP